MYNISRLFFSFQRRSSKLLPRRSWSASFTPFRNVMKRLKNDELFQEDKRREAVWCDLVFKLKEARPSRA